MKKLQSLLRDDNGQVSVEYAVIIFFLVMPLIYAFYYPGSDISPLQALVVYFSRIANLICLPGP